MKLLRYVFLLIAGSGALSFSVEGAEALSFTSSREYQQARTQVMKAEFTDRLLELNNSSWFLRDAPIIRLAADAFWGAQDEREQMLYNIVSLIHVANHIEHTKQETIAFLEAHDFENKQELINRMNGLFPSTVYKSGGFDDKQAQRNWAKFVSLVGDLPSDEGARLETILGHIKAIVPTEKQDQSCDFYNDLYAKTPQKGLPTKESYLESVLKRKGLPLAFSLPSSTPNPQPATPETQPKSDPLEGVTVDGRPVDQDELEEEVRRYQAGSDALDQTPPPNPQSIIPESIIPAVVRNHPLAWGLGSGGAVLLGLVAKIKADYDKNPSVDKSGAVIPFGKHLMDELISFKWFFAKAIALGLPGTGAYSCWNNLRAA